jgi:hypothetical protein
MVPGFCGRGVKVRNNVGVQRETADSGEDQPVESGASGTASEQPPDSASSNESNRPVDPTPAVLSQSPSAPQNVTAQRSLLVPVEAIANLFRESAERRQPRREKAFDRAFVISEADLRDLDRRIRQVFPTNSRHTVAISIAVRYADFMTESYASWDECFNEAGDEADAESLIATWECYNDDLSIYSASIEFITEKQLGSQRRLGPAPEAARIVISASGPSRQWVDSCFTSCEPLIRAARVSALYRPLEQFRHQIYRHILGWILAAALLTWCSFSSTRPSPRGSAYSIAWTRVRSTVFRDEQTERHRVGEIDFREF